MEYFELLRKILYSGQEYKPRGLRIKEIINAQLVIPSHYNYIGTEKSRKFNDTIKYSMGELAWYFSGDRKIEKILPYSSFWEKIKNKDNTANSNYGYLIFYKECRIGDNGTPGRTTTFSWAVSKLLEDKHTRQANILYNSRDYYFPGNKDFICSQYQHFLIRNNKLICIIGLRSSDAIYGLTYNIPWWSMVQQMVYLSIIEKYPEVTLGSIYVNISSAHLYENHFKLAENMLKENKEAYYLKLVNTIPLWKPVKWYEDNIENYIGITKI